MYSNIGAGGAVADLTNSAIFPNSPSSTNVITDYFDAPHDWADAYGTRMRAFVLPPVSGNYTFWIASDDNSVLFLSTDESPANKVQIASVAAWTGWREWAKEVNQKSALISLEAGRRYYLEALQKEGGGGDSLSIGWQLPGGSQELPIPATRGLPFTGVTARPPAILTQPTNLTVSDGRSATFGVLVSDPVPVRYGWQQGGIPVVGASNAICVLSSASTNLTGAQFRCVISNSVGAMTSAVATLTVLVDTNPPTLASVANAGLSAVRVLFSEPVESASATNRTNYSLSGGVVITNASLASDRQSALLTVSPLNLSLTYTQTVSNVRDASAARNVIAANSKIVFRPVLPGIFREVFQGLSGSTIPDLTNSLNFPTNPTVAQLVTDFFESPPNVDDNYGQRWRGLLIPPVTGNYIFWIASDDASNLLLSSDEDPAHKTLIASVNAWTGYREWTKEANQKSSPIQLTAGRRYYVEALHKEGSGGDSLSVRWQLPDITMEEPIPAFRFVPVGLTPPLILVQPANTSVVEGGSPVFAVQMSNRDPLGYQWQKNGTNVAGATNAVFTNLFVAITDDGARYHCVVTNILGATNTVEAVLSVAPDSVPPVILNVQNVGTTNVQIVFSERVEAASGTNRLNYSFLEGVVVSAATFGPDAKTILLTTSPLDFGSNYTLVVNRVRDRSSTPNGIATNTCVNFVAAEFATFDVGSPSVSGSMQAVVGGLAVTGGGNDISGALDQFGFSFQRRSGDFDMQARVLGITPSDVWAKAGLMARETLDANSRFAAVLATPSLAGVFFASRDPAGAAAVTIGNAPANYPYLWLRLKRTGNVFTGFASYDGQTWAPVGSNIIAMAGTVYFGMAVASHHATQPATAQFRNIGAVVGGTLRTLPALPFEPLGPSTRRCGLVISEIMFHPAPRSDGKRTEFVELFNSQPYPEEIGGFRLSGDIDFTFPAGTVLPGGAFVVVAKKPADVQSVYGLGGVFGPFTNNLSPNSGTLRLQNRSDAVLLEVNFDCRPPWPVAAGGTGHSLVLARPSYGEGNPKAWAASDVFGGSPGGMDGASFDPARTVVINEFLAHAEPPDLDFVELYNYSVLPVNLSGCWLSDDRATNKFRIADGTIIPARGFLAFDATQLGFGLSSGGEEIFLVNSNQTRVLDAVSYEAQAPGVSSGRFPDGAAQFYPLKTKTPGANNSAILVSDIVINEIMYNPPSGDDDDQFVELYNRGTNAVNLGNWQLADGIGFTFPMNFALPPNNYLVVARNAARLLTSYPSLNASNTIGDFSGTLAHGGERLALAMPDWVVSTNAGQTVTNLHHVVVDEVTFGQSGRWSRWAACGGSSLELTDPRANRRLAPNWADSDEASKAGWTNVEYTGLLDLGMDGWPANSLQIALAEAGECLIDNVEVVVQGTSVNLVTNSTFETGINGWFFQGTHNASYLEMNAGFNSGRSLHVVASERGDAGANRIRTTLSSPVASGTTATIRAKVRWLKGTPEILLRFRGSWLEAFGRMAVPRNLGTPGAPNSRAVTNAGPAITEVTHNPPVPTAGQPVMVTARVQDPDSVASVVLRYRLDPATTVTAVTMNDSGSGADAIAGDGVYSATIPGQAKSVLAAFYVQATDRYVPSASTRFPADGPVHECLVLFGDSTPVSTFGTYRMWMTQATASRWASLEKLSNELLDCTFVYGNTRVVYNAGSHFAGSPFHAQGFNTPTGNACNYKLVLPADEPVLGTTDFNKLHWPGNIGGDDTMQREETSYWIAGQLGLPFNYTRYVNLFINGVQRNVIMEDMQTPGSDMLEQWFPNDADGDLYKVSVWAEFDDAAAGFGAWGASLGNYTTIGGAKKTARYRWDFQKRALKDSWNDYTNIFSLVDAVNDNSTNYTAHVESLVDVEEWMGIAAVEHITGNWDSWMNTGGQNNYLYKPEAGKWRALIWDINITLGMAGDGPMSDLFKVGDGTLNTMYSHPPFRRAYWRALRNAAYGPLESSRAGAMLDSVYASFQANGVAAGSPASVKDYIAQRRNYIISQLATVASVFSITNNGGVNFNTSNNVLLLGGLAPVEVKRITVNGVAYPTTWTGLNTWRLQLPLSAAGNSLEVQGWDLAGLAVSNATVGITITYTGSLDRPEDSLVFNEIMYHPAVTNAEYVEIFNRSTNATFDLSNYRIDGIDFTFPPGASLGPGRLAVVAKDRVAFASAYGSSLVVAGEFAGRLDRDGEMLKLLKPNLATGGYDLVNQVRYRNTPPWPGGADGFGSSLQLIDPRQDNHRVGNWSGTYTPPTTNATWRFVSVTSTNNNMSRLLIQLDGPGDVYLDDLFLAAGNMAGVGPNLIRNGDFESPILESPSLTNSYFIGTNYTNSALSTDIKHGGAASLHVVCSTYSSSINRIIYQNLSPAPSNGQICTLSYWYRPGGGGTNLFLRLQNSGLTTAVGISPFSSTTTANLTPGATNNVLAVLPTFPALWINEVQPVNLSGLTDLAGHRSPWLELFNAGTNAAPLDGIYLARNYSDLTEWAFPTGAVINPGEFKVIFADGATNESTLDELHASFFLGPGSGSVALVRLHLGEPQVLDYLDYAGVAPDHSFGSAPDGQPFDRQEFYYVTPRATNNASPAPLTVLINEWMADNTATIADPADGRFDDWFELYNPGTNTAWLAGYYLTDDLTNKFQFRIPDGFSIPPQGFLLVWADKETGENDPGLRPDLHVNFKLDAGGEAIGLFASDGSVIDAVTFLAQSPDVSLGRFPDGSAAVSFLPTPTPNQQNVGPCAQNEVRVAGVVVNGPLSVTISWTAGPGCQYIVQFKDDLAGDWSSLPGPVVGTGAIASKTDTSLTGNEQRFYRVVLVR